MIADPDALCPRCSLPMDQSGHHLVCCKFNNPVKRHQVVQDLLVTLYREAGHACRKEGKALDSTRPGDVLVFNRTKGRPAAVDVTIRDPLLPSGPMGTAAAYPAWQHRLEQAKVTKYTRQCTTLGWEFIPFLCDVFGNLGPEAHQCVARLAKVKHDNAPH